MTQKVDARTFVEAWQTSNSVDEVAQKTGLPKKYCSSRASTYRKRGVPLKRMTHTPRGGEDWQELADFARTFKEN